jgi:hypothetical protein
MQDNKIDLGKKLIYNLLVISILAFDAQKPDYDYKCPRLCSSF